MRLQHTVETFLPRWMEGCEKTLQVAMIGIALRMNLALATPVSRILRRVVKEKRVFYGQADCKGGQGEVSHLSPDRKQM